jgi:DNA-directed RNA polymerase subunit RPC12/RpoP
MSKPTTPTRRSSRCHVPHCLGHADERSAAVTCTRCQGQRWVLVKPASAPDPTDYVCIRCRAVLAGRNASDPLVTDAQRTSGLRLAGGNRHDGAIPPAKEAPIPLEGARTPAKAHGGRQ